MSKGALETLIAVRSALISPKHTRGEVKGRILVNKTNLDSLKVLSEAGIVEQVIIVNNSSIRLDKLEIGSENSYTEVTLLTLNLSDGKYYDSFDFYLKDNLTRQLESKFYIHEISYLSTVDAVPEKLKYHNHTIELIALLESISDLVQDDGDTKEIVFFQKRKLVLPIRYNSQSICEISFLDTLAEHFSNLHDKEERKSIFKAELVSLLYGINPNERFKHLLSNAAIIWSNYSKSHALYLENFSYYDLKSELDKDKLEYTKKLYGTVNEIQTKLIAVPAAYLLVLNQFDFTGGGNFKNILIVIGSLLFSILLEVLLRNQFGVLEYLENEIADFRSSLKERDTKVDLSEFVDSFGELNNISATQKKYLWIFRVVVWLVPLTSLVMYIKCHVV